MRQFIFGLMMLGGLGCAGVQPIGPLAKGLGTPKAQPAAEPEKADRAEPEPVPVSAARPVPPAKLIDPDEVTAETATAAVQRLTNEIDADHKTMPTPPRTAEVSVYKKGEKVR